MAMQSKLRGIFTPNMVPLDERGQINEPEYRRYIDWLVASGVHGLYPNGSTGEFLRFTALERRRIVEIMADQVAGRVPILAGAAEANVRETIAACEHYHELGVRAVAIVSPFYYKLSPDNVYAYFREIGRNTPVDVTLYNIPMFASPIDVPTIRRLSEECEKVVAIKDSSGDLAQMMRMIDAVRPNRPEFSFLTGWDPCLVSMMMIGCDGGTNAISGIIPTITRALYDRFTAGQWDEARRLQYHVLRLFDAILYSADFPEAVRAAIEAQGFRMGHGRQPLSDVHVAKIESLRPTLRKLISDMGATNQPLSRAGAAATIDTLQLGRIIEGVVSVLQERGMV